MYHLNMQRFHILNMKGVVKREGLSRRYFLLAFVLALSWSSIAEARQPSDAKNLKLNFGAVGDGIADDTEAIKRWLRDLKPGERGLAPAGIYRFTEPLTVVTQRLSLVGEGPYQTVFHFDGQPDVGDLVTIGDGSVAIRNWEISNLRIASSTKMKSGVGLRLRNFVRSSLTQVIIDGQDGNGNLWNGVWFDAVDHVIYRGLEARAQNTAIMLNGGRGRAPKAGLMLLQGKIALSTVGLHIGGAFGGLYVDQMDIIANKRNVVIDTQLVAEGNREIMFGSMLSIDSSTAGASITLNDRLSNSEAWLQLAGTWLATGTSDGLLIQPNVRWTVSYQGGTIFNFEGDGIRNLSDSAQVIVNGTVIRHNRGNGISGKANLQNPVFRNNGNKHKP